jgi:hypothetical protein
MYHKQKMSSICHRESELSCHVVILWILRNGLIQSTLSLEMSFTIDKEFLSFTGNYLLLTNGHGQVNPIKVQTLILRHILRHQINTVVLLR